MECSADGRLVYRGGTLPLSSAWQTRAERLAIAALAALPPAVGYVGFDVILGSADDGSEDVVVEVNPRLTTSYVGLRQLARQVASTHNVPLATVDSHGNLAAAMLKIVRGELIGLTFGTQRVEFVVEEASQSATE
jgi:predicted ATP-grasp superfamily ATP-dependent carboligase